METLSDVELSDLDTDPPLGAMICPGCFGDGMVPVYEFDSISSEDCTNCYCKGWIMPEENSLNQCPPGQPSHGIGHGDLTGWW